MTEVNVYPAWMNILKPQFKRIDDAWDVSDNNYYLFSGGGIPNIYKHVKNSIIDINSINKAKVKGYDYLMICIDTEENTINDTEQRILNEINQEDLILFGADLIIIEQQVCMETWFLGNRTVYKSNPQNPSFLECIRFYNVSKDNPELMGTNDPESTKAQYHYKYLREMFKERHMSYSKRNTSEVETSSYLSELINRYEGTGHITTFGKWYNFITTI